MMLKDLQGFLSELKEILQVLQESNLFQQPVLGDVVSRFFWVWSYPCRQAEEPVTPESWVRRDGERGAQRGNGSFSAR